MAQVPTGRVIEITTDGLIRSISNLSGKSNHLIERFIILVDL